MRRMIGATVVLLLVSCGGNSSGDSAGNIDPMTLKGVGPIKSIELPQTIDESLASKGEEIFKSKCTACHQIDSKVIGPALRGITKRRTPEWIMNMILNPENMLKEDPLAKQLLKEHNNVMMTNQNLTQEEVRAVLEYLRKNS